MTSKKYSSNLKMTFSVIKRNLWLMVLAFIGFIFAMPVATAISNQRKAQFMASLNDATQNEITQALQNTANNLNSIFYNCSIIIVIIGSILAAIVLFYYLTQRKQIDFYHSLPIKRGKLFAINYSAGFLIFLIPFAICVLLNACIIAAMGYGSFFNWGLYSLYVLKLILAFFALYSMMILAITLSGTIIMSLLLMIAMNGFCPLIIMLREVLHRYFYETFWSDSVTSLLWAKYTSPFFNAVQYNTEAIFNIILFLVGIAAIILALLCYKKRNSEVAGRSLAFKNSKHIVRVPLSLLGALCMALIFYMIGNYTLIWLYFGAIAGSILIAQFLQIWIEGEFSAIKKGWISVIVTAVIACGIFVYVSNDMGHYDTYLPEAGKVESVQIQMAGVNDYTTGFYMDSDSFLQSEEYEKITEWRNIVMTDEATINAVLGVAQYGIDNLQGHTDYATSYYEEPVDYSPLEDNSTKNASFIICYKLTGGKQVYRYYNSLPVKDIQEQIITIIDDQEYQKNYAYINSCDPKQIVISNVDNFKSRDYSGSDISDQDQRRLAETYAKEFKNLTGKTMSTEIPVAQLGLIFFTDVNLMPASAKEAIKIKDDFDTSYSFFMNYYPVYPSFTETIALIKELYGENFFDDDFNNIKNAEIYYNDNSGQEIQDPNSEEMYEKYNNSSFAGTMAYDEFVQMYNSNTTIHDKDSIKQILESTKDCEALYFTPFFNFDGTVGYYINYNNDSTAERVKLTK